jgi:hypothetical protein
MWVALLLVHSVTGATKRAFGTIAPALAASMGVDKAAIGALLSIGLWARLPGIAICSLWADYNPKILMAMGATLYGLCALGLYFSMDTYSTALWLMFLLTIGGWTTGFSSLAVPVKGRKMGSTYDMVPAGFGKGVAVLLFGSIALMTIGKFGPGAVFLVMGGLIGIATLLFLAVSVGVPMELKSKVRPDFSILKRKGIVRTIIFMVGYEGCLISLASMGMFILKMANPGVPFKVLLGKFILALAVPALCSRPIWATVAKFLDARKTLLTSMFVAFVAVAMVPSTPLLGLVIMSFASGAGTICFLPYLGDRWGRERVGETFAAISIPYMACTSFFPMMAGYTLKHYGTWTLCIILIMTVITGIIALGSEQNVTFKDKRNG